MLFLDDETTEWCFVAAGLSAESELRCRAGPLMHKACAIPETDSLSADADFDTRCCVRHDQRLRDNSEGGDFVFVGAKAGEAEVGAHLKGFGLELVKEVILVSSFEFERDDEAAHLLFAQPF